MQWSLQGSLIIIFLLFQCIQGTLRRFNSKGDPEDTEYLSENYQKPYSSSDIKNDGDRFLQLPVRARRQNTGGDPEASSFHFTEDTHQYALTNYLGEGSKVNHDTLLSFNIHDANRLARL